MAAIYRIYGPRLLRRCQATLRDRALADDAVQEVFVKLLRHGAGFRTADAPLGWLYRVADRCCFDVRARKLRERGAGEEIPSASA